ncbi:Aste57867_19702 [Aphanomyces stellatus]|uniref:Aste57867_19702 protein n=1 Tax=Aphanomyces stellatus TaxID=120398 RepID=A0A485LF15_9STRA|nr:hypothetical protein As57867_019637 [Aphanomyces stellatus]VFT96402.1 Aste57867_19702 [Aphanomyces stellatus]
MISSLTRLALVLVLTVASAACDVSITKIVNFGDSTSDTGNGAIKLTKGTIPSNVYFGGRFSNGPTYIEVASKLLNASLSSYAYGGATTDNSKIEGVLGRSPSWNGPLYTVPDVLQQVDLYLSEGDEDMDPSNILYTMWIGNNDASNNAAYKLNKTGTDIAASLYDVWNTLADNGAQNIVAFVPPFGTQFTTDFSIALQKNQRQLTQDRPDVNLGLFQLAPIYAAVLAAPQAFGFQHAEPCCSIPNGSCVYQGKPNATVCAKPDTYPVWDAASHPTAAMHRILGASFATFVQEWFA